MHVIWHAVHPDPVDRLVRRGGLADEIDVRVTAFGRVPRALDVGVAEHTLLDRRNRGRRADCGVAVAELTIHAKRSSMELVAEWNWLRRGLARGDDTRERKRRPSDQDDDEHAGCDDDCQATH